MRMRVSLTAFAVVAAGISGAALAQVCPPGHFYQTGICYLSGMPFGVVKAAAAAFTFGAVAGDAPLHGAAGSGQPVYPAVAPTCPPGYALYSGACYPAR